MRGDTQLSVPCKSCVVQRCVCSPALSHQVSTSLAQTMRRIFFGNDRHDPIPELDYLG